jgi:phage repressor protein C with HTH and peptisase S24 domain
MNPELLATRLFIRRLTDRLKTSPSGLAKMAGLATSTVNRPLREDDIKYNLSATTLLKLGRAGGLSPEETHRMLASARESVGLEAVDIPVEDTRTPAVAELRGQELALLPVYDLRLSAGPGAYFGEHPEPLYLEPFRQDWLRSLTQAPLGSIIVARVDGDSMWETLHDGDQVLLDVTKRRPSRDGLYGLRFADADELMVKRITVNPADKLLTIASDNPRYDTWRGIRQDAIHVVGRVFWIGRKV